MKRSNTADRARKRKEADERNARWAALTDTEKLAELTDRGHPDCGQAISLKAKVNAD